MIDSSRPKAAGSSVYPISEEPVITPVPASKTPQHQSIFIMAADEMESRRKPDKRRWSSSGSLGIHHY